MNEQAIPTSSAWRQDISALLRREKTALIETWKRRVLADPRVPTANALSESDLLDHVPTLTDQLAYVLEHCEIRMPLCEPDDPLAEVVAEAAREHARHRITSGYKLIEILREVAHYRAVIAELFEREHASISPEALRLVHATIDQAVMSSASEVERIAAAARDEALHRAERRAAELDAVIEAIPDGVYIGDASGLKRVNSTGMRMLGMDDALLLGSSIEELVAKLEIRDIVTRERVPADAQVFTRALAGEQVTREVIVQNQGTGENRMMRSAAAPVRIAGAIVGAVAVNTDITEQHAAAEALRREAELRERFLAVLTHDLRGPLSTILMSAQMFLRNEALPPWQSKGMRRIVNSADRITRMVRDLLDFTRARHAGGIPIVPAPCDLAEIASQAAEDALLQAPDRPVDLATRGNTRGTWDADRLAQLMQNLVGNAVTHSPAGTPIAIRIDGTADRVRFDVANQGTTIPEDRIPSLFEAFRRGASSSGEGLGLGLYIAREIAVAHGGTIDVHSTANETVFSVELPRTR